MSPAEGIDGKTPTCSWSVHVDGSHEVDALAKRVSVISASEDGAFERRIKDVHTGGRPECTMRGVPAKSHCEVVVPLPEGASARAVAVVSGSRTIELYAVRAPSYERAYVKTVRASVVLPPSSETAGSSKTPDDDAAGRRFECVAELDSAPFVAIVLRLFVPSSGAVADAEAALGLRGVVVELRPRSPRPRGTPTGSPLRLDALAAATRDIAGLPPGNADVSGASAAAMLTMLRGMTGVTGGDRHPTARPEDSRGARAIPAADDEAPKAAETAEGVAALSARVARVERALARFERGAFAAFDRIEARLEALEARRDRDAAIGLGGEGGPPDARTERET